MILKQSSVTPWEPSSRLRNEHSRNKLKENKGEWFEDGGRKSIEEPQEVFCTITSFGICIPKGQFVW